jgi:hypothetical protein
MKSMKKTLEMALFVLYPTLILLVILWSVL